jgi:hypothetical protein
MDLILDAKFDPLDEKDMAIFHELERDYLSPLYGTGQPYTLYRLTGG